MGGSKGAKVRMVPIGDAPRQRLQVALSKLWVLSILLGLAGCALPSYNYPCDPATSWHYGVNVGYQNSCLAFEARCEQNGLPSIECWP